MGGGHGGSKGTHAVMSEGMPCSGESAAAATTTLQPHLLLLPLRSRAALSHALSHAPSPRWWRGPGRPAGACQSGGTGGTRPRREGGRVGQAGQAGQDLGGVRGREGRTGRRGRDGEGGAGGEEAVKVPHKGSPRVHEYT